MESFNSAPKSAAENSKHESMRGKVIETADRLGYGAQFTDDMADTAASILLETGQGSTEQEMLENAVKLRVEAANAERSNAKLDPQPDGTVERRA